jgi:hypothetical protein
LPASNIAAEWCAAVVLAARQSAKATRVKDLSMRYAV